MSRFLFLSIITLGLFQAYWIHKNWKYLKERDGMSILPFWRGIFGVLYCHSIFDEIKFDEECKEIKSAEFSTAILATGWVLATIVSTILGYFEDTTFLILSILISLFSFLFFIPVQQYINDVNYTSNPRPEYHHWSMGQIVCLIFGVMLCVIFMLTLAGAAYIGGQF